MANVFKALWQHYVDDITVLKSTLWNGSDIVIDANVSLGATVARETWHDDDDDDDDDGSKYGWMVMDSLCLVVVVCNIQYPCCYDKAAPIVNVKLSLSLSSEEEK